jgi:hypothetical protein
LGAPEVVEKTIGMGPQKKKAPRRLNARGSVMDLASLFQGVNYLALMVEKLVFDHHDEVYALWE